MLTRGACWVFTDAEGSYQVHQGELYAFCSTRAGVLVVFIVVSGVEEVVRKLGWFEFQHGAHRWGRTTYPWQISLGVVCGAHICGLGDSDGLGSDENGAYNVWEYVVNVRHVDQASISVSADICAHRRSFAACMRIHAHLCLYFHVVVSPHPTSRQYFQVHGANLWSI